VVGLVTDIGQRRITGVRIEQRHDGHTEEMMAADLIVDATDRGSRTPVCWSSSGTRGPKRIEWRSGSATHLAATGCAPAPWVRTKESSPQLLPATPEQRTSLPKRGQTHPDSERNLK
jgi:hypothetical protein